MERERDGETSPSPNPSELLVIQDALDLSSSQGSYIKRTAALQRISSKHGPTSSVVSRTGSLHCDLLFGVCRLALPASLGEYYRTFRLSQISRDLWGFLRGFSEVPQRIHIYYPYAIKSQKTIRIMVWGT